MEASERRREEGSGTLKGACLCAHLGRVCRREIGPGRVTALRADLRFLGDGLRRNFAADAAVDGSVQCARTLRSRVHHSAAGLAYAAPGNLCPQGRQRTNPTDRWTPAGTLLVRPREYSEARLSHRHRRSTTSMVFVHHLRRIGAASTLRPKRALGRRAQPKHSGARRPGCRENEGARTSRQADQRVPSRGLLG